mgnify:CR=1 FL=1
MHYTEKTFKEEEENEEMDRSRVLKNDLFPLQFFDYTAISLFRKGVVNFLDNSKMEEQRDFVLTNR